jgi:hypothetical protein
MILAFDGAVVRDRAPFAVVSWHIIEKPALSLKRVDVRKLA